MIDQETIAGEDASSAGGTAQGIEEVYAAPAAMPAHEEPADGSAILDEARAFIGRFAVLPSDAALDAVTLWAAHTHAYNAFDVTPRLALLSSEPASGKGHPHGTGILTPAGWRRVEDLRADDQVIGSDGRPAEVLDCYRRGELPVYEVKFNDGSSVKVDGDHLWSAWTHNDLVRKVGPRTIDTRKLAETVRARWAIPMTQPVQFPHHSLPLDPYVLGVLIGDAHIREHGVELTTDEATLAEVNRRLPESYSVARRGASVTRGRRFGPGNPSVVLDALRVLGLNGKNAAGKFIPDVYLYADVGQRLDLLRGLMDTDGELHMQRWKGGPPRARTDFSSASETLRDQVAFLVESFGGTARKTFRATPSYTHKGEKHTGQPSYRLSINMPVNPFLTRQGWHPNVRCAPRRIVRSVTPCGTAPVTCLRVSAPDSLYLTEHCIVTHNTRVLDLLDLLVAMPKQVVDPTGPVVFVMIKEYSPTLLLDEADQMFGRSGGQAKRQVQAVLNSGYRRGSTVPRARKDSVEEYPVFAPVAFAGLGRLPDALMTRSVVVRMRRRRKGESCDAYMPRVHAPLGHAVGAALGAWAAGVLAELASAWPDIPGGVEDRAAEIWSPLLAVADVAGGRWPDRARRACEAIVLGAGGKPVRAPSLQLLDDIALVWPAGADRMATAELVRLLMDVPGTERNWSPEAAPRELAAMLRPHDIRPVKLRVGGGPPVQGYMRDAFPVLTAVRQETPAA